MARPYSVRLHTHWGPGIPGTYTVPPGKRAVIKSVVCANNEASAGVVGVTLNGIQIWNQSIPASGGVSVGGIMVVLNTGDKLSSAHSLGYMYTTISGYELDDPV